MQHRRRAALTHLIHRATPSISSLLLRGANSKFKTLSIPLCGRTRHALYNVLLLELVHFSFPHLSPLYTLETMLGMQPLG